MLIGVFAPNDFVKISSIPANSRTARTGPPEITPVPSAAGFIKTFPEPNLPWISCGIVVPTIGTLIKLSFAFSTAFWIRSEEHTSELQSRGHLVCRLLLEKKNIKQIH